MENRLGLTRESSFVPGFLWGHFKPNNAPGCQSVILLLQQIVKGVKELGGAISAAGDVKLADEANVLDGTSEGRTNLL
ncbi:hypothetical protein CEXT_699991 [Caerostris extrusa]|uniref:Uncharacterized protein n=1 Tax=Caerostris extrusa TaxID=172846 RepID=A0AAV4TNP3_CAEEX|nr:hypothetical protein CEXT_699991 [Caerostris extrusa]